MTEYYIKRRGQVLGPFQVEQLREFADSRKLFPNDIIGENRTGPFLPLAEALKSLPSEVSEPEDAAVPVPSTQGTPPPPNTVGQQASNDADVNVVHPDDGSYEKPRAIMVFAILNFVWAFFTAVGAVMRVASSEIAVSNAEGFVRVLEAMKSLPAYRLMHSMGFGVDLVQVVLLISAGVGLLRCRQWGRSISQIWAVIAIVGGIIFPVLGVLLVAMPLSDELAQLSEVERAGVLGGFAGGVCGGLLSLIYPAIQLVFFQRQNITSALR